MHRREAFATIWEGVVIPPGPDDVLNESDRSRVTASLRIATRASALALWQARHIAGRLQQIDPARPVELVQISTSGDRNQTDPLSQFGGVGVFTREVQRALLDGRADIAVHSLKDLPTEPVEGLTLAAVPERAPTHDALVLPVNSAVVASTDASDFIAALPPNARIGTGSLRRRAQLLHRRPDLALEEVRGNVDTRLRKLDEGQYDALVLAEAGLTRLGLAARISARLTPPLMFPAVGQGALGLECRTKDAVTRAALVALMDVPTHSSVLAERSLLASLRAGCHAPLGVAVTFDGETLHIEAVVLSPDGVQRIAATFDGKASDPVAAGESLAEKLRALGADALIGRTGTTA